MKLDRDQIGMVVALFLVASIAAVLLALTDILTREPIAAAQKAALHQALQQVLPKHANDPQADKIVFGENDNRVIIYPARNTSGNITALAWEVIAPDGYAGSIRILVGVKPKGYIYAIRITQNQETPGLGDGITKNTGWLASFVNQSLTTRIWKVKKDGGDFDQFTGATISPRAVVKAVKRALEFFKAQKSAIFARLETQAAEARLAAHSNTGGHHSE